MQQLAIEALARFVDEAFPDGVALLGGAPREQAEGGVSQAVFTAIFGKRLRGDAAGGKVDYVALYQDVREMIDEAHRDGTLKSVITKNVGNFVRRDPQLGVLLEEFRRPPERRREPEDPDALTDREREVLELMVDGVTSNRKLAKRLGVTENTVKFHVRNILDKLHLHNRAQVVAFALRHKLVEPAPDAG